MGVQVFGPYQGQVSLAFNQAEILDQLSDMAVMLQHATKLTNGSDKVYQSILECQGKQLTVAIKSFKRQGWLKGWFDRHKGSKAKRSWVAAEHLIQHDILTPQPVAYLEKWQGYRLLESYYISIFIAETSSFREELSQLLWHEPDNEKLIGLLEAVAPCVRQMHDNGLMHGDMGNQNILLQRLDDNHWHNVQFIDLNRAQISRSLSWQKRAYDLSRLAIPSDYLRIFKWIYCQGNIHPLLEKHESHYRHRYRRHARTYKYRHPIRAYRHARDCRNDPTHQLDYPLEKDLWVWDQRSAQAMVMLSSADRKRHYHKMDWLRILVHTVWHGPKIWRTYKQLGKQHFQSQVVMGNRLGIAVNPHPEYIEYEFQQIMDLGKPPVLIRFCCHETQAEWDAAIDLIARYRAVEVPVAVALLQNRRAVTDSQYWQAFIDYIVPKIQDQVEFIEVAHAVNRVKWGIWQQSEYQRLLSQFVVLQQQYPKLRLTGPAGIDFEYPQVWSLLCQLPKGIRLSALSHHLYVDRRGAPENRQGHFSTLEKCALAKAMAMCAPQCEDRLIVSEVNWPLKGTNVYSPIGSPYQMPGTLPADEPGFTEVEYAQYMIRYISIALCSGHVASIYWWRLSAHGYGIIDDIARPDWRPRPAFDALKVWLRFVGQGVFIKRLESDDTIYLLLFETQAETWLLAWSSKGPCQVSVPLQYKKQLDFLGLPLTNGEDGGKLSLNQCPSYFLIK